VAYYLPRNVALDEVAGLLSPATTVTTNGTVAMTPNKMVDLKEEREWDHGKPTLGVDAKGEGAEMVEVEEEWMGTKLKAVTCYFGGLAGGQEGSF
jgi:trimethylguanosine synthase